nr:hypothetical protein [Novosphingobium clariflavum]
MVAITEGRIEHPEPVLKTSLHSILGLFAILLTLMLRDACKQMLHQQTIGVRAKLDGRRFQHPARARNVGAEFQVRLDPARQTADVVDDDDHIIFAVLFEKRQHGNHPRTPGERAGHIIAEYLHDLMTTIASVFAAARFL